MGLPSNPDRHSLVVITDKVAFALYFNGVSTSMQTLFGASRNSGVLTYEDFGPIIQYNVSFDNAAIATKILIAETYLKHGE